ncbi:MAG: PA14 domain-containing protein [Myxococcota bacterium]
MLARVREALTFRGAIDRAKARDIDAQEKGARALQRSAEHAAMARSLWLSHSDQAQETAEESLAAAVEAATHLLGDAPEDKKALTELDEILAASRAIRRRIGNDYRTVTELRILRALRWLALVAGLAFVVMLIVLEIQRRIELANAPWTVQYWENESFEGSPTTEVGWQDISHDWQSQGPFDESDGFSLRMDTCIHVPEAQAVEFTVASDDGSRVFVNGERVVNNWGMHGVRSRSGTAELEAGKHLVRVEYFERGGGASLRFSMGGDYEVSPPSDGACP